MTIEEMIGIKEERGYSFQRLSEYSGVPVVTIQKIFSGKTKAPRKATLDAIEKVLQAEENIYQGKAFEYASANKKEVPDIVESALKYGVAYPADVEKSEFEAKYGIKEKKQGEYTTEDYFEIPEDVRVEVIDGVLYDMATPDYIHQMILSRMHFAFSLHILQKGKKCHVLQAPTGVQISCDDKTMVEPDLIVLCDKSKIRKFGIYGAPDFLLEVLSPSTRLKDLSVKLGKYQESGVREYWIIDPIREKLIIYNFMEENFIPQILPLTGEAEVAISEGELKINLDEIQEMIEEYKGLE
ncbi:MAG: Uma2 family endonuclease [Dorea sp.]|nr:Uma2 family endonuclease [Dorea sp.]